MAEACLRDVVISWMVPHAGPCGLEHQEPPGSPRLTLTQFFSVAVTEWHWSRLLQCSFPIHSELQESSCISLWPFSVLRTFKGHSSHQSPDHRPPPQPREADMFLAPCKGREIEAGTHPRTSPDPDGLVC